MNIMKVKNITPHKKSHGNLCVAGMGCSSVFETDRNTFIVVGKIPATKDLPRNVLKKLGKGEAVVEVPKGGCPLSSASRKTQQGIRLHYCAVGSRSTRIR